MKVLVLGVINSQWTFQFTKTFLRKNNYEIWMVKKGCDRESRKWASLYTKIGVHFIDCTSQAAYIAEAKCEKSFLKGLCAHIAYIRAIVRAGDFNVINMQYVNYDDVIHAAILKYIIKAKLVYSYWGSDLLRLSGRQLYFNGLFVKHADFITFDNRDLEFKFKETYAWASKIPSKTILFGLPVLDIIQRRDGEKTSENIRTEWEIPKDKKVIAVGYSAVAEHHHIEVLRRIEQMDAEKKKEIFLLLQMTYNGTDRYIKQVADAAKKTGCEYRVLRHYLTNEEVADLRIMTDIYINAQTTDAFSGSVCENLFAGTILINAEWLRYQEFKDYDFQYLEFQDMDEIGRLVQTAMEKKIDVSKNRKLVWRLRSWECCAPKWQRMFQRLLRENSRKRG